MAGSRSCSVLYTAFDVQIFSDEVSTKTYVDLFLDLSGNLREVPLQARSNYVKFDSIKPLNRGGSGNLNNTYKWYFAPQMML